MLGSRLFRWLVTPLATLLCVAGADAHGQSIDNTARADWLESGLQRSTVSNTVSIGLQALPASISTYRLDTRGSTALSVRPSVCNGSEVLIPGSTSGTASSLTASVANTLRAGQTLVVEIHAPLPDLDPAAVDRLIATIVTTSGDRETIEIFETGLNTGRFTGAIQTGRTSGLTAADCRLSVSSGDQVSVQVSRLGSGLPLIATIVGVLADPFGIVFDSADGEPVNGARVTLVESVTGTPASVLAEDGVTPWPSTVTTGSTVTDAAGTTSQLRAGEFWFPLAPLGTYRLVVEPPAPYAAPSQASERELAALTGPAGRTLIISDASFGRPFSLTDPTPVQVDIPVDRPVTPLTLTKSASRARAQPGDPVFYEIVVANPDQARAKSGVIVSDLPSPWLRLRPDSLKVNGQVAPANMVAITADGREFSLSLPPIAPGQSTRITYAMTIRADAAPGEALNRVEAVDNRGERVVAQVAVRIDRDDIASRMTIIGRVTEGSCERHTARRGIPGVRIMLEDGSFAITDNDGRYHFEGVTPGTHVVQAQRQTLPGKSGEFVDCDRSTRSAGSASSRFVIGQGGSLVVADFAAELPGWEPAEARVSDRDTAPASEDGATAAAGSLATGHTAFSDDDINAAGGGDRDWFAVGNGPPAFLFPEVDHNPRSPAVRAVIRHAPNHTVRLYTNGRPVDALAFDGTKVAPDGQFAVSVWRGIPLGNEPTNLVAELLEANGSAVTTLQREVVFVSGPWNAEIIHERSNLIADGKGRPVVAVRLTDRRGRPVRSGVSGTVAINAPYESAAMLDHLQLRQLAGKGPVAPTWTIEGDDGLALIELAPTMISGPLHLQFDFSDDRSTRRRELDTWVVPGDLDWTVIGLAEGSVGARTVAENMEREGRFDSDLGDNARLALYAKGRILGRFLLTLAYDSAKQPDDQRLLGAIDPAAYYSVFADGSDRRFDAASREKLYVRIESRTFYALYGDFVTGFDQTVLARYQRTATGVKAEGQFGALHAQGFAAEVAGRFRRDEIQGAGISGPYRLSSRAALANSEKVAIEARDRFRSELIVERRELSRFVDYDIDLLSGTIRFREPVLSRDFQLNPQFIVVEYEVDEGTGATNWNAGARADYSFGDDRLRVGASLLSDKGENERTEVGGMDVRARLGARTEIRAEVAASRGNGQSARAWLFEAEHRSGVLDVLAYAREVGEDFGVGHISGAEAGRRKIGVDTRYALNERLSFTASAWHDDALVDASRRQALQAFVNHRSSSGEARLGLSHFADRSPIGERSSSTLVEGAITHRMLGNRLELGAASSIAFGKAESIDLPARHRLRAGYAVSEWLRLVGNYELADGETIDARTFNAGVEISPWSGSRIVTTLGRQEISEMGKRSYAAFGLSQSLPVTSELSVDATIDGNRALAGADPLAVINPAHPVASGGHISPNSGLFEDFSAVTLGASWRRDRWAATARVEYRDGQFADRRGFTAGLIRQLGEGVVVGSGINWTRATSTAEAETEILDAALSFAYRPAESPLSMLGKLAFRSDRVTGALEGETGPAGRTKLLVTGDAQSQRLVASLSSNWSPQSGQGDKLIGRTELGAFLGIRHGLDRYEGYDLAGTTLLGGLDARFGLGERIEVGGAATVRANIGSGEKAYAIGPQLGFTPTRDTLVTIGYNVAGFRDRDFSEARSTEKGIYAAVRLKFDVDSFSFLGLGRR